MDPEIVFDLSRLLSRTRFSAPTGVDRVEMAYARELIARRPERVSFAALHPCGLYGRLPAPAAERFLAETAADWSGERRPSAVLARRAATMLRLMRTVPDLTATPLARQMRPRVYLQVSPHHLDRRALVGRILRRERARFVCLVHDLIPIEFPEYARPGGPDQHRRRMRTVAEFADGVIVASEAMKRSFLSHLGRGARTPEIRAIPLGAEPAAARAYGAPSPGRRPYFLMIGTIEPRKNHLLLLNLWRRLVEERGAAATPKLVLVGRRGWENENILDMLDRCPALKGVVEEHGHIADERLWPLLQGARALLMPSFAEGFGLPIVEAMQAGAPVICSDIPAHREVAGAAGEFLDPLDGPAWGRAILDYAAPVSPRRAAQLARLAEWRAPTWEAHVNTALDLIDGISR